MTDGKCKQLPPLRLRSGRCPSARSMSLDSARSLDGPTSHMSEAPFRLPPVDVSPNVTTRRLSTTVEKVEPDTILVSTTVEKVEPDAIWVKKDVKSTEPLSPSTDEGVLSRAVQVLEESKKATEPTHVVQSGPFYAGDSTRQTLVAEVRKAAVMHAALLFLRDCFSIIEESELLLRTLEDAAIRCKTWKSKAESPEDDNSWSVLSEDEISAFANGIKKQGKQWSHLQARLSATDLLHPIPDLLKMHLGKIKSDLCTFHVKALVWTETVLDSIINLALRSSSLPNQWLSSVLRLCDVYNGAVSSYGGVVSRPPGNPADPWGALQASGSVLTPISASHLLHLIARQRSHHSTSIWCEKLFQPITPIPEHLCVEGQAVQWLPKVSELTYWTVRTPSPSVAETSGYQSGTSGPTCSQAPDINTSQLGEFQAIFVKEELYIQQWLTELQHVGNLVSRSSPGTSVCLREKQKSSADSDKVVQGLTSVYMDLYQDALQKTIGTELSNLRFDAHSSHPGSTNFWPCTVLLLVAEKGEELAHCHDDSRPAMVLRSVAQQLRVKAALSSWEQNFHEALSACADHRCPLLLSAETNVGTKAGHLIGASLQPLLALLPQLQHSGKGSPQDLAETAMLPRLNATLKLVLWWLDGRVQQLLALWQVGQYLLITHSDLKHLVDLLKHLSAVCPTTLGSLPHPVPIEWRYHVFLVSGWWDNINSMTTQIQNIASTSIQQFYRSCHLMAADAVAAHMPQGKLWKRKYRMHGPPSAHNSYVDEVISTVLWPVLEGVKHLSMPVQISVVSMATKAFCEAWMAHICKRKIKFSLYGAQLLRLDFLQLTTWLQRLPELSVEARQSIQALDILRRLHGASLLLMRQPRSNQRFRKTKVSPAISIADVSTLEADRTDGPAGPAEEPSVSDSLTDEDFVPNKEEWLSLRVHGGPPRWHALWCLALPCD